MAGPSNYQRRTDQFDFTRFVFTKGIFGGRIFTKVVSFHGATFAEAADFGVAIFTEAVDFQLAIFTEVGDFGRATFTKAADFAGAIFTKAAIFGGATFTGTADFAGVIFTKAAIFGGATFTEAVDFRVATFSETANFCVVRFLKPDLVQFLRTNQERIGMKKGGLRARFVSCQIEGVRFEAVNWCRRKGRMVLQDELDLTEQPSEATSHEEIAIAYRRLISNFEQACAYDLVEDCTIGEFEMKRKDPSRFIFANFLGPYYKRFSWLRWLGEWVSVVGVYWLLSLYGTSYRRALGMLGVFLVAFGLLFSVVGIIPVEPGVDARCGVENAFKCLANGFFHAVEVAMLQRDSVYKPVTPSGFMVEILEQVFVAGQAALFLFALRRRFRR